MEKCLAYFRQAVANPQSVPPWSEWWAVNANLVERVFPRMDFVRLKHRRLRGAWVILQKAGELPEDFRPRGALFTGSCGYRGERTTILGGRGGGHVTCPNCGILEHFHCSPDRHNSKAWDGEPPA
jgi:hypothetical protein